MGCPKVFSTWGYMYPDVPKTVARKKINKSDANKFGARHFSKLIKLDENGYHVVKYG